MELCVMFVIQIAILALEVHFIASAVLSHYFWIQLLASLHVQMRNIQMALFVNFAILPAKLVRDRNQQTVCHVLLQDYSTHFNV